MIPPISREETLDLTQEALGPGWLRRFPTNPEAHEIAGPGVWRTGPQLLFRNELVAAMERAREVILLSSFLLADDAQVIAGKAAESPDDAAEIAALAEGVGFEPTVELPPRRFSRPLP